MFAYPYLTGIMLLALVWIFFFLRRRDLRQQLLMMSVLTTPLAPISQILFFAHDYWNPHYWLSWNIAGTAVGIEEPLFAFFVGGIGAVIYEVLRKRRYTAGSSRPILSSVVIVLTILVFLILKWAGLNSIWASTCALILGGVSMILMDGDLIPDAVWSAAYFVALCLILYFILLMLFPNIFSELWLKGGLSGVTLARVPVEEVLWFFSWGLWSGVVYEFWINVESYKKIRTPDSRARA